jgi:hypothetical protein
MHKHFFRVAMLGMLLITLALQMRPASAGSAFAYWYEPQLLHCDNDSVSLQYYRKYELPEGTYSTFHAEVNNPVPPTYVGGVDMVGKYEDAQLTATGLGFWPVPYPYQYQIIVHAHDDNGKILTTSFIEIRCFGDGKGTIYSKHYEG